MVSNGLQDTVGYSFFPGPGFTERFLVHDDKRSLASAPVVLPDGHTVLAATDVADKHETGRLSFAGPNFAPLADLTGVLGAITAAPTRLADGRLVVIERFGGHISVFSGGNGTTTQIRLHPFTGSSIASAAASCNYLYVASAGEFTTFDAKNLAQVATVPWYGGGRSSPATYMLSQRILCSCSRRPDVRRSPSPGQRASRQLPPAAVVRSTAADSTS